MAAEFIHVPAARKLERIVMEADIAFAVLVFLALRVGGGDPQSGLAVAPAHHVPPVFVHWLEAEESEELGIKLLRGSKSPTLKTI